MMGQFEDIAKSLHLLADWTAQDLLEESMYVRATCESGSAAIKQLYEKLNFYESTGLSPEEFKESVEFTLELNKKLKPYMDAEEQGLLVILPCKIGDTVYEVVKKRVDLTGYRMEWGWETVVEAVKFRIGMLDSVGKTVFLTREEAESVLMNYLEVEND